MVYSGEDSILLHLFMTRWCIVGRMVFYYSFSGHDVVHIVCRIVFYYIFSGHDGGGARGESAAAGQSHEDSQGLQGTSSFHNDLLLTCVCMFTE